MNPVEIVLLAFSSLRSNKLRAGLTMLGITVGIFSVIGVMTIITAMRTTVENGLNVLGANSFQVNKYPAVNFSDPRERFANRKDITYAQGRRFAELMTDYAKVSLIMRRGGRRVTYQERYTNPNVSLIATDGNFLAARDYSIALGRNLTDQDVQLGRPVIVIGDELAKRLFPSEDPLGADIRMDGQRYTVIGTLESKGSSFGQTQDNLALVPISRFFQVYGRAGRSLSINVQAPDARSVDDTQDHAIGAMRLVRGLEPEDPNDFEIFNNDTLIDAFNNITRTISIGAFVISAIALLAAGVGVMNIMLVSVTERTKEIGIRKSIGARQHNILSQFLLEAVVVSMVGGAFGVAVGVGGGNIIGSMIGGTVTMPWFWVFTGLAVCCGIGVAFGFYPAWKAAKLDPIEALRFE